MRQVAARVKHPCFGVRVASVHKINRLHLENVACRGEKLLFEKTVFKTFCGEKDDKYVKTPEVAATLSLKAGLDLECGDHIYVDPLLNAYRQYMVTEAEIDSAAYHVLRARMKLGLFDDPELNPYNRILPGIVGCEAHKQLALEAARQSLVLLKNQQHFLPLQADKIKSIAVVGINAGNCEFGDYSGTPVNEAVSVLEGIRRRVGDRVKVVYAPWVSVDAGSELITKSYFPEGLKAEYFDNKDLQGTEVTGTNTMYENVQIGPVKAGDIKVGEFVQKMTLQGRNYLISFGCVGVSNNRFNVYHRLYDVCNINVISDKDTVGFFDMNSIVTVSDEK